MSSSSPPDSNILSVPEINNNTLFPTQPSEQPSFRAQKLEVPNLNLTIPTFGNIPQSPTRVDLPDDPPVEEKEKETELQPVPPPKKRPSLFRSGTKAETLPVPKHPLMKRPSRTFVRNFSMIYPPAFSDLETKEADASPTMLKEYKYRRLDSGSGITDDQPNFEANEPPKGLSLFGLRTLELQNSNNTSLNDSQGNISSKSLNQSVSTKKHERKKLNSSGPNPYMPYLTQKTHDTLSAVTLNTSESSDDDEPIPEHRMRLRRILKKSFLATYFMGILFGFKNRVQIYGALRPIEYFKEFEAKKSIKKKHSYFPILPTSMFSIIWMVALIILMAMNAIITPIYVSFIETDGGPFYYINLIFDIGFGADIIINFITAYYDEEKNLVTDFSKIVKTYLSYWFWIDVAAILPIDEIIIAIAQDDSISANNVNKLLRLLRFPKLYRMLRVFRLVKVVRLFSSHHFFAKILKKLNLNIGALHLLKIIVNLFFLNHFVGCLWFFIARLDEFNPDTWVARGGLIDKDIGTQYIASLYWVFQTFTTVGYGDIIPKTVIEKIICAIWPVVSVGVYSFLIGNLGQVLSHMDIRSEVFTEKISSFERFSSQVKLPDFLRQKVKRFFEINHKENVCHWADPNDTLKDLPANLKTSVLLYSYYGLITNIKLLQVDPNFTAALLVHLKLMKLKDEELLYREDDPPHEVYFISKGAVKFVTESAQGIFSVAEGTYFGEMEILEESKRLCFCQAMGSTVILVCPRAIFLKILVEFPDIQAQIQKISQMRKKKLEERLIQIRKGESTTERTKLSSHDRVHVKTTEYINSVLLKIAAKQIRGDNSVDDIGIQMDEEEKKEFLKKKKSGGSDLVSNESLGSITERMKTDRIKKPSEPKLSLVDRLKKLKTKHGDASKKPNRSSKKEFKDSKEEFDSELHTGNSPPQSSTSLIKLSHMIVETLPTNPECDISQTRKLDTTGFDLLKEPPSDITIQRINTANFSVPKVSQMEEISLLAEEKAKTQDKIREEKQGGVKPSSLQNESSSMDSRIISFEKSIAGSIFSTNLSSLLKDKGLEKQKFLPKSNKIAPIIVSSRGKESSKYISLEERMNLQGLRDDSDDDDTPQRVNVKSPY